MHVKRPVFVDVGVRGTLVCVFKRGKLLDTRYARTGYRNECEGYVGMHACIASTSGPRPFASHPPPPHTPKFPLSDNDTAVPPGHFLTDVK